jgi:hypothetical protein
MQMIEDAEIHNKNTQTQQTDAYSEGNSESKHEIFEKPLSRD